MCHKFLQFSVPRLSNQAHNTEWHSQTLSCPVKGSKMRICERLKQVHRPDLHTKQLCESDHDPRGSSPALHM